ncbi:glycosyltransferase family 4 protein [Epibacterium ulvae]|uniref:glycosyltransferase family 4 protein n=1 Tax=Epibacterium ulvae TaxID=1156985 RepID=UPI002491167A|nr:glycosyltransferase family 4 protein [Epibacterium ulvae]
MLQESHRGAAPIAPQNDTVVEKTAAPADFRLKIVHSAETAVGGVGTYMDILCAFTENFENILLVHENETQLLDPSRQIVTYPGKSRGLSRTISQCRALLRLYDKEKPDIVFLHSTFSLAPLLVLSLLRPSAKTIYCAHGWAVSQYTSKGPLISRIVAAVEGGLSGLAKRVINISQHDLQLAKGRRYRGRHVLVENAVPDLPEASGTETVDLDHTLDPDKINLLFVGRHDTQKGLDILLDAFRRVSAQRQDIALYIVGASVRSDTTALDLPKGAVSVGWVDRARIDDWYGAVDALVVPSRWEGFGLVVAEAFRNGTPALVSDRGALPNLVETSKTGEIFDLNPEDLARVLEDCDKTDLNQRRAACRSVYETRFSRQRFSTEITDVYYDILKEI